MGPCEPIAGGIVGFENRGWKNQDEGLGIFLILEFVKLICPPFWFLLFTILPSL